MTLLQLAVLAVVQGFTEFLPISSSGHLVLAPVVMGWPDQGLMLDVAVHVGTLGAVVVYLWRDLWMMVVDIFRAFAGRRGPGLKLAAYIVVATIPVIIAGLALKTAVPAGIRSAEVIGWSFIVFGVVLYLADRFGMTVRKIEHLSWAGAIYIGLAQVLALIPGASRSGTTITMARVLGMERREAARFSMMLSIPAILGAGVLEGKALLDSGDLALQATVVMAAGMAFVAALVAIVAMMGWLRHASYTPFVIYRVVVGAAILYLFV
ncbi:MAG: undecaprenyl-diphosphate phosphatase [Alphaproteobacteria bacterium]|nr:undecaprenyl-diphosphate phosphatase [Alphaproteobacteria bacterium]